MTFIEVDGVLPVKPMNNDYTINIQGYNTSNPQLKRNEIWIDAELKWISVRDRLPENDDEVLVYHGRDQHISCGYFEESNVSFYIESDGSKFYTNSGWETEIPWAPKGGVTHWMPLPEPPRE